MPELLRATAKLDGVAVRVKSAAALTTRLTDAVCTRFPLDAVMVSGYVPNGVAEVVFTANVEDPEPVTELGLKLAVAPEGSPLILKVTAPLNPPVDAMFTV